MSAQEVQPSKDTCRNWLATAVKWLWASRNAGSSVLPARSTRWTSIPVWSSTAVLPPTAAIRPLRTNRAWASGLFRSRVRMVPFSKRMSMRFLLFSQFTAAGRVPYPGVKLQV